MQNLESAKLVRWDELPWESMKSDIDRRLITGTNTMIAQIYLKKDAVVPLHSHHNEQITYVLEGALEFLLGDRQEDRVIVRAGDVLTIPPNLPHSARALEDTLDIDVFNPPRQDWLDGSDSYLREPAR